MGRRSRTFRVFVNSTFSDLKAERNALQADTFSRLRELCTNHGCRFQAIDLRWGLSEEERAKYVTAAERVVSWVLAEIEKDKAN